MERGTIEDVQMLLQLGADPKQANAYGRTPLHRAAARHPGRVQPANFIYLLCGAGADPSACTTDGTAPLHVAASARHVSAVSALCAAGADVNACDAQWRSPLWFGVFADSVPCCAALLEALADPCRRVPGRHDRGGDTVMEYAEVSRRHDVVALLREFVRLNCENLAQAAEAEAWAAAEAGPKAAQEALLELEARVSFYQGLLGDQHRRHRRRFLSPSAETLSPA